MLEQVNIIKTGKEKPKLETNNSVIEDFVNDYNGPWPYVDAPGQNLLRGIMPEVRQTIQEIESIDKSLGVDSMDKLPPKIDKIKQVGFDILAPRASYFEQSEVLTETFRNAYNYLFNINANIIKGIAHKFERKAVIKEFKRILRIIAEKPEENKDVIEDDKFIEKLKKIIIETKILKDVIEKSPGNNIEKINEFKQLAKEFVGVNSSEFRKEVLKAGPKSIGEQTRVLSSNEYKIPVDKRAVNELKTKKYSEK